MKKKILICLISVFFLSIIYYLMKKHYEPFKYGNTISKLNIDYDSKVISYNRSVGDFDGSIEMRIEFVIDSNKLESIEKQCIELNYKHPPVLLGKDSVRYSGNPKFIYYLSLKNKNGSDFVIFNKAKRLLLIEQNNTNQLVRQCFRVSGITGNVGRVSKLVMTPNQ